MPKVNFNVMSSETCAICHAPLKQNLVDAQATSDKPIICFKCFRDHRTMLTASEVRAGKEIALKVYT